MTLKSLTIEYRFDPFLKFVSLFRRLEKNMPMEDSGSSAGPRVDREQRRPALFKYWKWPNKNKILDNENTVGFLRDFGCVNRAAHPAKALRRNLSSPPPVSGVSRHPLACGHMPPICACILLTFSCSMSPPPLSHKTLAIGLNPTRIIRVISS